MESYSAFEQRAEASSRITRRYLNLTTKRDDNGQKPLVLFGSSLIVLGLVFTIIQFIVQVITVTQQVGSEVSESFLRRSLDIGGAGANIGVQTTYVGILVMLLGVILLSVVYLSNVSFAQLVAKSRKS